MQYEVTEGELKALDDIFTYHPPTENQGVRYNYIRTCGREMAEALMRMCPHSDELATAIKHIQDAVMWANSAIARHELEPVAVAEVPNDANQ